MMIKRFLDDLHVFLRHLVEDACGEGAGEVVAACVEVGPASNGLVLINEIGPAHSYSFGYDAKTGLMTAETMINNATSTRLDVRCTQSVE